MNTDCSRTEILYMQANQNKTCTLYSKSLPTVRGYNLLRQVNVQSHMSGGTANVETEVIRDLFTKKQALLLELRNYEGNSQFSEICAGDMGQQLALANQHVGIIPVSFLALNRHRLILHTLQLLTFLISVPCMNSLVH